MEGGGCDGGEVERGGEVVKFGCSGGGEAE